MIQTTFAREGPRCTPPESPTLVSCCVLCVGCVCDHCSQSVGTRPEMLRVVLFAAAVAASASASQCSVTPGGPIDGPCERGREYCGPAFDESTPRFHIQDETCGENVRARALRACCWGVCCCIIEDAARHALPSLLTGPQLPAVRSAAWALSPFLAGTSCVPAGTRARHRSRCLCRLGEVGALTRRSVERHALRQRGHLHRLRDDC